MNLPKININPQVKSKFENLLKTQGFIAALQVLAPIDISFKILANVCTKGGCRHDIAVLFRANAGEALIQDPKDLELFISQMLAERGSQAHATTEKCRYEKQEYIAVYVDRQ